MTPPLRKARTVTYVVGLLPMFLVAHSHLHFSGTGTRMGENLETHPKHNDAQAGTNCGHGCPKGMRERTCAMGPIALAFCLLSACGPRESAPRAAISVVAAAPPAPKPNNFCRYRSFHPKSIHTVILVSAETMAEVLAPALEAACICMPPPHARIRVEFSIYPELGEIVTHRAEDADIEACMRLQLNPGRFNPFEVESDNIGPELKRPNPSAPTIDSRRTNPQPLQIATIRYPLVFE